MSNTQLTHRPDAHTRFEIDAEIQRLLAERSERTAPYGPQFATLWALACRFMQGGKLLRPRLLLGAYDALTEAPGSDAIARPVAVQVSAALEILHFAFLLHDDIIDEDLLRRGEPNLMGHLAGVCPDEASPAHQRADADPRRLHWARSSGILVGDLMLTIAHQVFARARVPEEHRIRMLDLLDETVTETVAGEYCDVGLADGCIAPDLDMVLTMTRMKTATYTFELPLRVAAIIAGADQNCERQLGEVGRHLGIAFQLQDDLLSAFETSETHGKDEFSDFRERKETALIAYARETQEWPSISRYLCDTDFSVESGRAIQALLTQCGAREFIDSMVETQIAAAVTLTTQLGSGTHEPLSRFVLTLIDSLSGRRS